MQSASLAFFMVFLWYVCGVPYARIDIYACVFEAIMRKDTLAREQAIKALASQGMGATLLRGVVTLTRWRFQHGVIQPSPKPVFKIPPSQTTNTIRKSRVIPGKWVSMRTSEYVAEQMASDAVSAAAEIEYAVRALVNSIADGLREEGLESFELAAGGQFHEGVVRAILFRLPVRFYAEIFFINSMYRDFVKAVAAGRITHPEWHLSVNAAGHITVALAKDAGHGG
ncbi:MAG: hypothetical protein ABT02_05115 [Comamonadaceae bacterium SCN 68-20]|nr:MAG: hypothetical protein ABT02_05115 [Comamonadaceae bacterium SCN 68-20]